MHAVAAALTNFERNVVLLLGGRDKGLDLSILKRHASRIRLLVCYGESGEVIRECLGFDGALYAYRFDEAVRTAIAHCRPGDVLQSADADDVGHCGGLPQSSLVKVHPLGYSCAENEAYTAWKRIEATAVTASPCPYGMFAARLIAPRETPSPR